MFFQLSISITDLTFAIFFCVCVRSLCASPRDHVLQGSEQQSDQERGGQTVWNAAQSQRIVSIVAVLYGHFFWFIWQGIAVAADLFVIRISFWLAFRLSGKGKEAEAFNGVKGSGSCVCCFLWRPSLSDEDPNGRQQ
jgi:hypothetical protein